MAGSPLLMGVNVVAAVASGAFGAIAIANPSSLVGQPVSSAPATAFYVDMYGLRSIAIAAGLVTAALSVRRAPRAAALCLAGGGLVQVGDVVIAARFGTSGVVGASLAAAIHVASAALVWSRFRPSC